VNIPFDVDAEMAVLGSMMADPTVVDELRTKLTASQFSLPGHSAVFQALLDQRDSDDPFELLATFHRLPVGSGVTAGDLAVLYESCVDWCNAGYYAGIVAQHAERRRLMAVGHRLVSDASDSLSDPGELASAAVREIGSGEHNGKVAFEESRKLLADLPGYLADSSLAFVDTALPGYNREFGGIAKSNLTILAARPSVGKTAFALQSALAAMFRGATVLFVTIEMPRMEIAARIAAMIGGCVAGFLEWVNAEPGTNDPWEADSIYLR